MPTETGQEQEQSIQAPHQPLRVLFMGTPNFAVPSLRALAEHTALGQPCSAGLDIVGVVTRPDKTAGRGRQMVYSPVKEYALQQGLAVYQPGSLRKPEAQALLTSLHPDVISVAAFGQILPPEVLRLPPHGCLNVHASLLPRHRGASPISAAILAGDEETGVTIMQMDPGLDTGPMLRARALPIERSDTTGTLTEKLSQVGAELLIEVLPAWIAGTLQATPQDDAAATYAPMLEKEAGRIDWRKPAEQLWREVRAYNPWPISTALLGGEPLQILE